MQTSSGVCGGIVTELLRLGLLHRKSKGWVIHTKSDWLCSVRYERGQVRPGCSLGSHCNLIPAMQSSSKNTCLTSKQFLFYAVNKFISFHKVCIYEVNSYLHIALEKLKYLSKGFCTFRVGRCLIHCQMTVIWVVCSLLKVILCKRKSFIFVSNI